MPELDRWIRDRERPYRLESQIDFTATDEIRDQRHHPTLIDAEQQQSNERPGAEHEAGRIRVTRRQRAHRVQHRQPRDEDQRIETKTDETEERENAGHG